MLSYITWIVEPEIFPNVDWLPVRWYGLMFAFAFFFGYTIVQRMFVYEKLNEKWLDGLLIYTMVGTIVGARLGHVFFYDWEYYSQNLGEIIMINNGGLASHGAAIGIILSLYLWSRKYSKKSVLWILDRIVIVVALAGFFIRMGNLFNHEIIGVASDVPWAFIFTKAYVADPLTPRHPAQLYEALCYLAIFIVMIRQYYRSNWKDLQGFFFGFFLVAIFWVRFFVEFIKENQVEFEEGMALNMGQWLSIPAVLVGAYFMYRGRGHKP
ncbi:MAG: prolipoprotein diacylglyceryl transferase [Flavobacteriales bacterium]|nr:prolipoprotein diacylglyceryl transferase [Flavobacteriales bacterium]